MITQTIHEIDSSKLASPTNKHYNCSIIKYDNQLLMAYRIGTRKTMMAVCSLNDQLQPTHKGLILFKDEPIPHAEDPRLFIYDNKLFCSYTAFTKERVRTQGICELSKTFTAVKHWELKYSKASRVEKNWQFFENSGKLYCLYSIYPHLVCEVDLEKSSIHDRYMSTYKHSWEWGEPRGGTPPIKTIDGYMSIFHSSYIDNSIYNGRIYVAGCYIFDDEKPFAIRRLSKYPLLKPDIDDVPHRNKSAVVFPCGAIVEDDKIMISYGYHDKSCRILETSYLDIISSTEQVQGNLNQIDNFI